MIAFSERLRQRALRLQTWLCVGLDPDPSRFPACVPRTAEGAVALCQAVCEATVDRAAAFKINFAFFERFGPEGWEAIARVRSFVPAEVPVIADAKRGDIGNTSQMYAEAIFDCLGFDAVTVSPYLGQDGVAPFLDYQGKGVIVLCRTSNPGASEFQDLSVDGEPLYLLIARRALSWPAKADVGLVVGATRPEALERVRALDPDVIILVPGVGAQGAAAQEAVQAGANRQGDNALVAVSRQVLYASEGPDFAAAAGRAAAELAGQTWQKAASYAHH